MKDNLIATRAIAQQTPEQSLLVDSCLCPSKAEQILGDVWERFGKGSEKVQKRFEMIRRSSGEVEKEMN